MGHLATQNFKNMNIVELIKVWKFYKWRGGIITALRNVTLKIELGEMVCIVGPSGAGKTTLLKVAGGLLKPDRGKVLIFGRDPYEGPRKNFIRKISFIPQEDSLIEGLTVWENVALPALLSGIPVDERVRAVHNALKTLGIEELAERGVNEISAGEKRKVCIARAIVNDPSLIFADEPTSNLDSKSINEIIKLFKLLNDKGITILISTHDFRLVNSFERVIEIRDGKIVKNESNKFNN